MTRHNTRTIRIHNLHLVIRNFCDKALGPARSEMYGPASSVTVLNYRVRHHHGGVSFASFVTGAENRGAALGVPASAFNVLRLSGPRHSPIYSTLRRRTVIRPPVRGQATKKEWNLA